MMTDGNEDPNGFERLCESQYRKVARFRDNYPELEIVFGMLMDCGSVMVGLVSEIRSMTTNETHRWRMWQTVFGYQQQSLLLITAASTDAGLALLRLAAELARDVAVIGEKDELLELWIHRRDQTRRREYQKRFRFDDLSSAGAMAHKAYDRCSEFGVHGHMTDAMHLEVAGDPSANRSDGLLILTVSDLGILRALQLWLTSFGALHLLCLESFALRHRQLFSKQHIMFLDALEAIEPVIAGISQRIRELTPKPN